MKTFISVIIAIVLATTSWAAKTIINHGNKISTLEANGENNTYLLKEVRQDVKSILKKL